VARQWLYEVQPQGALAADSPSPFGK